jgi:hypothetical protein
LTGDEKETFFSIFCPSGDILMSSQPALFVTNKDFPLSAKNKRSGETVVSAACQDAQRNRAAIPTGINIFFFIFSLV